MLSFQSELPDVSVGWLDGGEVIARPVRQLFEDGLYLLVGVPGAYTPICSRDHIPTLIEQADALHNAGVKDIYCVSDDNPWTLKNWQSSFEGGEKLKFISDGNRALLQAIKMTNTQDDLFIAGKYARFYTLIYNGKVQRTRMETSVLETACTDGLSILSDIQSLQSALSA